MCKHGQEVIVSVKIPADLSHTGEARWKDCGIDACIADIVRALQAAGIDMRASCCGHGDRPGEIRLQDGRTVIVQQPELITGENPPMSESTVPSQVMTRDHVDVMRFAIPHFGPDVFLLGQVESLVRSIVSGELFTFDPRTHVAVQRDAIESTADILAIERLPNCAAVVRGWLTPDTSKESKE
jgi:hypothetical protein